MNLPNTSPVTSVESILYCYHTANQIPADEVASSGNDNTVEKTCVNII